jgi:hypothetical protein
MIPAYEQMPSKLISFHPPSYIYYAGRSLNIPQVSMNAAKFQCPVISKQRTKQTHQATRHNTQHTPQTKQNKKVKKK